MRIINAYTRRLVEHMTSYYIRVQYSNSVHNAKKTIVPLFHLKTEYNRKICLFFSVTMSRHQNRLSYTSPTPYPQSSAARNTFRNLSLENMFYRRQCARRACTSCIINELFLDCSTFYYFKIYYSLENTLKTRQSVDPIYVVSIPQGSSNTARLRLNCQKLFEEI